MDKKGHPGSKGGHPGGKPGGPPTGAPAGDIDLEALVDVSEKGANERTLDKRLFIQLLCFGECGDAKPLVEELKKSGFDAVLYADIGDPYGVALLTMSEDPAFFTGPLRDFIKGGAFSKLLLKEEMTMLGRTYAIGHERDLEDWLLKRSRRVATNPEWPWAVWYPLRRTGDFALLSKKEQGGILMEHGTIGRAFGEADLGHDIRLTCQGLDKFDNDFVIALIGKDLHPLSALVQTMRGTKQTSTYIEKMGPFFVGRVIYQSS